MKMDWENTEQIINHFDLDASFDDSEKIKKELRKKISQSHPDTNNQETQSHEQKKYWQELLEAKEFMDKENNHQLISISQLPSLIKALTASELIPIDSRINNIKQEAHETLHRKNSLPRIGSGVFAAITGFLFTFSGSLSEHPVLGGLFSSYTSQIVLLALIFYSGVFFVFTWSKERKQEETITWLTSNAGVKKIISNVLREKNKEENSSALILSAQDLVNEMHNRKQYNEHDPIRYILGSSQLPLQIAEKIASIQIDTLIERGVMAELPVNGFDKKYEISALAAKELCRK